MIRYGTLSGHKPSRNLAAQRRIELCYPFDWKHGRHWAVKRRECMGLVGGAAAAWPLAGRAQSRTVRRAGVLMNGTATQAAVQSYLAACIPGNHECPP